MLPRELPSFTQMSADHTYRRLNRCGIDNCKASLYYLEDGQWFCKNGHRREVGIYITGSCRIYPEAKIEKGRARP